MALASESAQRANITECNRVLDPTKGIVLNIQL